MIMVIVAAYRWIYDNYFLRLSSILPLEKTSVWTRSSPTVSSKCVKTSKNHASLPTAAFKFSRYILWFLPISQIVKSPLLPSITKKYTLYTASKWSKLLPKTSLTNTALSYRCAYKQQNSILSKCVFGTSQWGLQGMNVIRFIHPEILIMIPMTSTLRLLTGESMTKD